MKNLDWFNLDLLAKWRWRMLKEDNEPWRQILSARYGIEYEGSAHLDLGFALKKGSAWWKGICRLGKLNQSED